MCQRTVRSSDNPVEQAVINQEAERSLLAAFINGLIGASGNQVRLQMPETIDKALNMAIVATNAEREEKTFTQDDRGTNARVFTVGGSRENIGRNAYNKPRGKFQWSGNRGAGSQPQVRQTQYSGRVDGTYSDRTDSRTAMPSENHARTIGGGAASGPKNDDDRCAPRRPHDIRCFNCGLLGHIRSSCPRGQRRSLNGIGRTKVAPPSYPK